MWYTILITVVIDLGGLLLVYVLLRDRVRRATSAEAQISEIRDEVSSLVVELNQTTDRNIALVEDRIASLNEQLSVADKKIGLLRREIEKHDVGAQVYSRLGEVRPRPPAPAPLPPLSVELSERPAPEGADAPAADREAPQEQDSRTPGRQVREERETGSTSPRQGVREEPGPAPRAPAGRREEAGDLRDRIMLLFRAGFAASLIASRVGVPLGEVELIISLEQRKGQG